MRVSLLFLVPVQAFAQPAFERVSTDIQHEYVGGWEHFVGGGVAAFDCDGDQLAELFVAGGEGPAVLLRNESSSNLSFRADTPDVLALTNVIGAYPLDMDNDDVLDLFVMRVGENMLLKGDDNCQFASFADTLNFTDVTAWTTAFSATWEESNDQPTLAVGNYVDRDDPNGPFMACDQNYLYRPNAYDTPIALEPGYCPLSMLFTDWGRRGRQDLRVSNDRQYYVRGGSEQMWAMEMTPRLYGEADGWRDYSIWGMGIASSDIDGDGLPEVFLSSMGDQKLQSLDQNSDGPVYIDATYDRGTTAHRPYVGDDGRPSTGWHVAFGDVDNDGQEDVFITKGNVEQMPGAAMQDPNNLLIQQPDDSFVEMGDVSGLASFERGRGAAMLDLNLDGLLDIVVVNRRAPIEIYQNVTDVGGNWMLLDIRQADTNTRAVGAWVEVRTPTRTYSREITVGGGHASGTSTLLHFGLADIETADVRIIWPDDEVTDWMPMNSNAIHSIKRTADGVLIDDQ